MKNKKLKLKLNIIKGNELILDCKKIKIETEKDFEQSNLYKYIMNGWNEDNIIPKYKNYYLKNDLLSTELGCIMYGSRVII